METATIENRADFAQWAMIEPVTAIIADNGANFALAARGEHVAESANALC